jgi:hypothetical protein
MSRRMMVAVLLACGRTGNVGAGMWAHVHARKTGWLYSYSACCECGRGYVVQCKCGDACSAREVFEPLRGHGMKLSCSKRCNGKGSCLMPWHSWGVLGCCAHAGAVEVGREICRACRWNMPLSQQFSTTGVWWIYLEGLVFWRRHMH